MKIKNLLVSKDGKMSPSVINAAIIGLIVLVVLFLVYSVIIPEAQTAGNALNASNQCTSNSCFFNATGTNSTCFAVKGNEGIVCAVSSTQTAIPLAGLFSGTGVVFVVIMAALIILVVKAYLKKQEIG